MSGHYRPDEQSLEIGIHAFEVSGITFVGEPKGSDGNHGCNEGHDGENGEHHDIIYGYDSDNNTHYDNKEHDLDIKKLSEGVGEILAEAKQHMSEEMGQSEDEDTQMPEWAERLDEQVKDANDPANQLVIYPIDESEEPFLPHERKIAELLQSEGKRVKSLLEDHTRYGVKSADAVVDGVRTEFKTPHPKPGKVTTSNTVKDEVSKSIKGDIQARHMIIDARGSGLTEEEAQRTLGRVKTYDITKGRLDYLRIIGDGYNLELTDFKRTPRE